MQNSVITRFVAFATCSLSTLTIAACSSDAPADGMPLTGGQPGVAGANTSGGAGGGVDPMGMAGAGVGGDATGGVGGDATGGVGGGVGGDVNGGAGGDVNGGAGGDVNGGAGGDTNAGAGGDVNGGAGGMDDPGPKPKILFVSGANHHNWLVQDPYLLAILEWSQMFESVEYMVLPSASDDASWAAWSPTWEDYDVVVHNLDLQHSNFGRDWPDQVKRNFEAYMQNGGGMASLHAGTHGWENWPEYDKMTGGGWRGASYGCSWEVVDGVQTMIPQGSGAGAADVNFTDQLIHVLDPEHPITKGLPPVWKMITDNSSVYQRGPCENITVLDYAHSNDGYYPVSWTNTYGEGRFFFIAPMHVMPDSSDAVFHEMDDVGFQTMWIRGIEWAATGEVTYPLPDNLPTETTTSRNDISDYQAP